MAEDVSAVSRDRFVKVRVLENGLKAAITVTPARGEGKEPSTEMAYQALRKERVVFGIDTDLVETVFREKRFDQEVVVAFGKPAVDGKDGRIKYFFDAKQKIKPKEDEKGNVDYKDIRLIQNVSKGDKLAELIPPEPGKEGKSVTDRKILPAIGKILKLPQGQNTQPSPDNPNILIASIDGNVKLKGGLVQVESIYIVGGDVDFKTGNLDYVGSFFIKGDVKAGFEVRSKGDVEINGLVEDTKIFAGGNVIIKKGFLGKGNGLIKADGNVNLKFCEHQNITAKGDIIVGEAVLHSNLQSESKIEVTGKKGIIVGGVTRATKGLIVKELGNYQDIKTEVIAGVDEELLKRLDEVETEKVKSDGNLDQVKKAIYVLYKNKMSAGELPEDQERLLKKLKNLQKQIPERKKQLEEKKVKIEEEMQKYADVTVDVLSKVYPGTRITIQNFKKTITDETTKVRFQVIENEIKERTL